jgi:nicotinamidase-related amidase
MKKMDLNEYKKEDTVICIIDMNNGFAKKGNLYSPNVEALIPNMVDFLYEMRKKGVTVITINDSHDENAREFKVYPSHCIKGTVECDTVSELKGFVDQGYYKNSTNALLAIDYKNLFVEREKVVVIGCVTDICIKQFAITLNKYFDEFNLDKKVIVIEDLVTTFDMEGHEAGIFHQNAIMEMQLNGIEIVNYKAQQRFEKVYEKRY